MKRKLPNLIRKYSFTVTYCTVWGGSLFASMSPAVRGFAADLSGAALTIKGFR